MWCHMQSSSSLNLFDSCWSSVSTSLIGSDFCRRNGKVRQEMALVGKPYLDANSINCGNEPVHRWFQLILTFFSLQIYFGRSPPRQSYSEFQSTLSCSTTVYSLTPQVGLLLWWIVQWVDVRSPSPSIARVTRHQVKQSLEKFCSSRALVSGTADCFEE